MSLAKIKTILDYTVSDGKFKLACEIEPPMNTNINMIGLYYLDITDNKVIALGRRTQVGLYSQEIQVVIRHNDKSKARDVSYSALQLLGINRDSAGTFIKFIDTQAPTYGGIDDKGGHIYSFIINMKGEK